jgi:hypothetical protein
MAFSGDPECAAMFDTLGLTFEGSVTPNAPQSVLTVR